MNKILITLCFFALLPNASESSLHEQNCNSVRPRLNSFQDPEHALIPTDFLVPGDAFSDLSEISVGRANWIITSEAFSEWLSRNGKFGLLVALNDKRQLEREGEFSLDEQDLNEIEEQHPAIRPDRICDYAYQIARKDFGVPAMSYRDNLEERDRLIRALIANLTE